MWLRYLFCQQVGDIPDGFIKECIPFILLRYSRLILTVLSHQSLDNILLTVLSHQSLINTLLTLSKPGQNTFNISFYNGPSPSKPG